MCTVHTVHNTDSPSDQIDVAVFTTGLQRTKTLHEPPAESGRSWGGQKGRETVKAARQAYS